MHSAAALGWGAAKSSDARPGNIPLGVAWGTGYQNRFRRMTTAQQTAVLDKMVANGITWARIDAEWWTVQPTSGAYDWTVVDPVVTAISNAGINVVVLLSSAPAWAKNPANTPPLNVPYSTPDPAKYAAYCAAAVTHYSAMGVTVFELWNEPNLTTGASVSGWAHQLVAGFGGLAVAAYPAMKAANPNAYVLAGTFATANEFGTAGNDRAASWGAVSAGATTATITSAGAVSSEAPGFLSGGGWPTGTRVMSVTAGTSYTVAPPPWSTGGFPAISAGSGTIRVQNTMLAPDFFLARLYEYTAGRPWCDALAIHPYTPPVLPSAQLPQFGGWAVVPTMRNTMIANGDGAKPMWITEVGAPTGGISGASWPAAASTATSVVVSSSQAAAADVNYQLTGTGLPAGCWVSAVTAGTSWTVRPSTGLTLSAALSTAGPLTSVTVAATPGGAVTIPSGTALTIGPPVTLGTYIANTQTVTTSGAVTTSTTGTTVVPANSFTPTDAFPVGSVVLGLLGQTFGAAITAASGQKVTLAAQGVPVVSSAVDDTMQAAIITESLRSIVRGLPGGAGSAPGSPPWPYAHGAPVFIYCWADSNAGMFGLERVDGTSKAAALTAVRQVAAMGA
jgi:hypothetical protein